MRPLMPYAVTSLVVVVASLVAVGTTALERWPSPGPSPSVHPRVALSTTARIAYWRSDPQRHRRELWVGDLDGPRKWTVTSVDDRTQVRLTRWSRDGSAVAYLADGSALTIAHVDGAPLTTIALPTTLLDDGWRIVSVEWSPDSARVAATVRSGNAIGNDSDVYVADARVGAQWHRTTTIGDAFADEWIDGDRMFVETSSGMIGVLDVASGGIRPITGMPAASPILGRDGRVYFVGGRSARTYVSAEPYASGWVWSATIDGDDVRRETSVTVDQARLVGMLADGRAVVAASGAAFVAKDHRVALSFRAGTIGSVEIADDGRHIVGWTGSRLLLVDASKVTGAASLPPQSAASVLLDDVSGGDVWYPGSAVALAHIPPAAAVGAPRARLAFMLGGSLWESDPDGATRLVASGTQRYASPPRWSPGGDRLAFLSIEGSPPQAKAIVAGPTGTTRWDAPVAFGTPQWSADGRSLLFAAPAPRSTLPRPFMGWATEVFDVDRGVVTAQLPGRVTDGPAGRVVLTDGTPKPGTSLLLHQQVDLMTNAGTRTITDADRLASALPGSPIGDDPWIQGIVPIGDPAYLGVSMSYAERVGGTLLRGAFAVIRVADGGLVWSLPQTQPSTAPPYGYGDVSTSPVSRDVAWTESTDTANDLSTQRTVIVDPVIGRTLATVPGRFAGWSPDPAWIYVARFEGLFAARVDGSAVVRVGPYGVPVAAARP